MAVDEVEDEITASVSTPVLESCRRRCTWCESPTHSEIDEYCAWCTAIRHAARFVTIAVIERVLAEKRAGLL